MGALVAPKASRADCICYARDYIRWARMTQGDRPRVLAHLRLAARWRTLARGRA